MLHIVNKSPFQSTSLQTCLRMAKPGSAVLLIEDGIFAATTGTSVEAMVRQAAGAIKFYALQPDVDARGATGKVMDGITLVDYSGFVDLTLEYSTSHSWL